MLDNVKVNKRHTLPLAKYQLKHEPGRNNTSLFKLLFLDIPLNHDLNLLFGTLLRNSPLHNCPPPPLGSPDTIVFSDHKASSLRTETHSYQCSCGVYVQTAHSCQGDSRVEQDLIRSLAAGRSGGIGRRKGGGGGEGREREKENTPELESD